VNTIKPKSPGNQIGLSFFYLTAGSLFSQALLLLSLIIIARHLGGNLFGQYAGIYATIGIISVLFNYGIDTWLMREGGRDSRNIAIGISTGWLLKTLMGTAILLTVIATSLLTGLWSFSAGLLALASLGYIFDGWASLAYSCFKSQLNNRPTALLQILGGLGLFLISVLLTFYQGSNASLMAGRTLVSLMTAILALLWVRRLYPWKWDLSFLPDLYRRGLVYCLSDLMIAIYLKADVALLSLIRGDKLVGEYAPAAMLVNAFFLIPTIFYNTLYPLLSKLYYNEHQARFRQLAFNTLIGMGALGVLLSLFIERTSSLLINHIFGYDFQASGLVLKSLSFLLIFKCVSFALAIILLAANRQTQRLIVQGLTAVINLGLNLLLIPSYGVWGAVWAYLLSEGFLCFGYGLQVLKLLSTLQPPSSSDEYITN
jgi:O-antigen/teichoic acid export membrane protein